MFRKFFSKNDTTEEQEELIDLPPLEELEQWVLSVVIKLELKKGTFTFLPAYGGLILFIKDEGIVWIPYSDVQDLLGDVDKGKLVESTALLGGAAAVTAGVLALPALLIPKLLKGSYRILAKPSPKETMTFLKSLISEIMIEEREVNNSLLKTFEKQPFSEEKNTLKVFIITIKRKFFDKKAQENVVEKFAKGISTFISGTKDPVFIAPGQSEIEKFSSILQKNGISVTRNISETGERSGNNENRSVKTDN